VTDDQAMSGREWPPQLLPEHPRGWACRFAL